MERDLAALGLLADLAQRRTPFGRGIRSGDMLEQFAQSLRAELDFRREADAMDEMAGRLDRAAGVRVPTVYRHLCTRRLLVQERFEGCTVADSAGLDSMGADREGLADKLVRSTLDQVITLGFFHADPHPGNIFVLADGSLGLIDFGATGRLDPIQQAAIIDIFFAMAQRDVRLLRDGVERVAELRRRHVARRARACARPAHGRARPTGRRGRSARDAGARHDARPVRPAPAGRHRAAVARPRHPRRHAAGALPRPLADDGVHRRCSAHRATR